MHFQSENTVFKVLRRAWYRQGQSVNAVLEKFRGLCLQSEIQNSEHDFRIQQKLEEEVLRIHDVFCEHSREAKIGLKIGQFKKSGVKLYCSTKGQGTDFCFKLSKNRGSRIAFRSWVISVIS